MDNYNYPMGSDTPDAPWNQSENPEKEIEVTVCISLSKTIKIRVSDYEITDCGKDEDGYYFEDVDYSNCDLKGAVEEQITLPHKVGQLLVDMDDNPIKMSHKLKNIKEDLCGWNVDELEVIID